MLKFLLTVLSIFVATDLLAQSSQRPPWNQTSQSSLEDAANDSSLLGVATFLVPAPEVGVLEERVVIVPNISYSEAAKRAANTVAFEWHSPRYWETVANEKASCGLWGAGGKSCPSSCMCGSGNHCSKKGSIER